jgi:5-formyltetrahydrofolate cyclo-ligase
MVALRDRLSEREVRGAALAARVEALEVFQAARVISAYVGVGAEVPTVPLIEQVFSRGQSVAVPWVEAGSLYLTSIGSLDDLVAAPFGLLEPTAALKQEPDRRILPERVQLYLVPGLAFDREGGRLGHGRGYYDRLLRAAGPDPYRVGLGFECQLIDRVPMTARDEPMDVVVTEAGVYRITARTAWVDR